MANGDKLIPLVDDEGLNRVVGGGPTILYKHSDRCFVCQRSLRHMERFSEERPGVPVYIVDVIAKRSLSSRIAERLGVPHESPQAILVQDGRPVWNASHSGVTTTALERELDGLDEAG